MRVGILATHPIQYQVPWYRALAARPEIDLTVYYALVPDARQQGVGFDAAFRWDVPLFDGYRWKALVNASRAASLRGFWRNRVRGLVRQWRSDALEAVIITGWQSLALFQGIGSGARLGLPCLVRGESNLLRERSRWRAAAQRLLLRRFSAALAIGRRNREFYLARGVPAERIFPAPYFVDNERIRAQHERALPRRAEIRARWGIGRDAVCFLFAGKLEEKKRPGDLLDALERVRAGDGDAREAAVLFAGSGPLRAALEEGARRRGLPVSFAGFLNQTEITDAYAAADALVLPSDAGETWGLVVNEAMVCGLPAIVSDRVGCAADLVDPGTGAAFPAGDVGTLARLLREWSRDPLRLREMGRAARDRIAAYSVEAATAGTVEALRFATQGAR